MENTHPIKVEIWHNILWSKYKAAVLSELYSLLENSAYQARFFQIAETESNRVALGKADHSCHRYPYKLIFPGVLTDTPLWKRVFVLARRAMTTKADCVVLAGYERAEYWGQLLILAMRRRKIMVFCDSTIYDQPQSKVKGALKRFFFSLCNGAFCYGERSSAYLQYYGMPREKISSRCQAAALPDFYSREAVIEFRSKMSPSSPPRFLYVGRLSPEKRIDTLINAFDVFLKNHPAARLQIVGSGPEDAKLKLLALSLGGSAQIEFLGPKSTEELSTLYMSATAMVLPSYSEPWGLVVNEAFAYGCPAIVSHRCGCVPELIDGSKVGMSFECDNVDDLVDKLGQAVDRYSNYRQVTLEALEAIAPYSSVKAATEICQGISRTMQQ